MIKSPFIFQLYVRQKGLGSKLQSGMFSLSPSMTVEQITKTLTTGPEGIWVRFIEGWRKEEYAKELNKKLGIDEKEFLKIAKEGYMFPDSYLFPKDATSDYVVSALENTFNNRFTDDLRSKIKAKGLSEQEGIILASIVEREARSDRAREDVASILLKRLKIDMGLNADATLQYIYGFSEDEKIWWTKTHIVESKQSDSPFNTYKFRGLPPAPICNPSLSSIKAVANANLDTPYLYYYHDSKGIPRYAETLDEHNANIVNFP